MPLMWPIRSPQCRRSTHCQQGGQCLRTVVPFQTASLWLNACTCQSERIPSLFFFVSVISFTQITPIIINRTLTLPHPKTLSNPNCSFHHNSVGIFTLFSITYPLTRDPQLLLETQTNQRAHFHKKNLRCLLPDSMLLTSCPILVFSTKNSQLSTHITNKNRKPNSKKANTETCTKCLFTNNL